MIPDIDLNIEELRRQRRVLLEGWKAFYRYHVQQASSLSANDMDELLFDIGTDVLEDAEFRQFVRSVWRER